MTRRERLENKLAKRQDWAHKAKNRATQAFNRADSIADAIPFGQPILVGHHSERHARADQNRIHGAMNKGVEETKLAEHHQQAASGISQQLDGCIFSDDQNAIESLKVRIAEREAKANHMVALNKSWRKSKGDVAAFAKLAGISESTAQRMADNIAQAYSWEKQPVPAWELANLRATIRKDKQRIEELK